MTQHFDLSRSSLSVKPIQVETLCVIKSCISVMNYDIFDYSYLLCTIDLVVELRKSVIVQHPPPILLLLTYYTVLLLHLGTIHPAGSNGGYSNHDQ